MKAILTIIFICAISATASAQFNSKNKQSGNSLAGAPLKDRIFFGGGGGFSGGTDQYGNRYFYFSLSPLVGYRVTAPFSVGLQVLYQNVHYTNIGYSFNQYGLAPFMSYRFGQLFAYGEFQVINAPRAVSQGQSTSENRGMYTRLPIGLGFTQPIGQRAAINVVALYDVLWASQRLTSPFATPWVLRVYVTAGGVGLF